MLASSKISRKYEIYPQEHKNCRNGRKFKAIPKNINPIYAESPYGGQQIYTEETLKEYYARTSNTSIGRLS